MGHFKQFSALAFRALVGLDAIEKTQCFPFFTFDDHRNHIENITDWALRLFRAHYDDRRISKWDIFHYIYGILHHGGYVEAFADCLRRELPRIPFVRTIEDFRAFRNAGKALAKLHVGYESVEPYELEWIESEDHPLSLRVEQMRLAKDRRSVIINESLTLAGIPQEAFEYRLGNRSAIDWVIDQYRVQRDGDGKIISDPNRHDDEEYIVRLLQQVVTISVRTVEIVGALPKSFGGAPSAAALKAALAGEPPEIDVADSDHDGHAPNGKRSFTLRADSPHKQLRLGSSS